MCNTLCACLRNRFWCSNPWRNVLEEEAKEMPQTSLNTGYTQKNGAFLILFTIKTATFFCVVTSTGHTQKNGAVLIVFTIKIAPFFCVYPVLVTLYLIPSGVHPVAICRQSQVSLFDEHANPCTHHTHRSVQHVS
jgi:hypothetical protein